MTLIVLLVVNIICAAIGAWLFRTNGRPAWVGGLLGFVFGVVGLAVAAIVMATSRRRGGATTAV